MVSLHRFMARNGHKSVHFAAPIQVSIIHMIKKGVRLEGGVPIPGGVILSAVIEIVRQTVQVVDVPRLKQAI